MTRSWQASLFMGIVTLILGIIVAAHPTGSLNVIAVLLGVLSSLTVLAVLVGIWFIVMGVLEIIGAFMFRHAFRTEGPPAV